MAVMNQIAIEPKVVDELESTYQDIGFTPPNIDIENSLNIYINSLENVEKHERQHRIEAWIKAQLNPNLTVWESKYSQTLICCIVPVQRFKNWNKPKRETK